MYKALSTAIANNEIEKIHLLIKNKEFNINKILVEAVKDKNAKFISFLFNEFPDEHLKHINTSYILRMAVIYADKKIFDIVIEFDPIKDNDNDVPLIFIAIINRKLEIIEELLSKYPNMINQEERFTKRTPLHFAILTQDEFLKEHNNLNRHQDIPELINTNQLTDMNHSDMRFEIVKCLLDKGAAIKQDSNRKTPIDFLNKQISEKNKIYENDGTYSYKAKNELEELTKIRNIFIEANAIPLQNLTSPDVIQRVIGNFSTIIQDLKFKNSLNEARLDKLENEVKEQREINKQLYTMNKRLRDSQEESKESNKKPNNNFNNVSFQAPGLFHK